MALAPLATATDLEVKGVDISTNPELVTMMLNAASYVIREAAGCAISEETSTVKLLAPEGRWLTLPGPITAVTTVLMDGVAFTDWKFVGGMLWHPWGWNYGTFTYQRPLRFDLCVPVEVTVTYTHGFAEVPADIVSLCVDLAKLGIEAASDDSLLSQPANVVSSSFTIDDHTERVQFSELHTQTLLELPAATKAWLAQRFGGGVYVTSELQ